MGLDVSHNCWHGAYSAFHRFRQELCRAAGWDGAVAWFESGPFDAGEFIITDEMGQDPLIFLIDHSDCDGKIKKKHCLPLAKRLKELLPLVDDSISGGHLSMKADVKQFIAGLRLAHKHKESVEFR